MDQVDNRLMSVWKDEMSPCVVISENYYCIICKEFNIGIDLACVVNGDKEQKWAQYCSLWNPGGDVYPVSS